MKTMQTTCNYCSLACNFDVTSDGKTITKVIPTKNYPVNKGFSCIKGLNLNKQGLMNSPDSKPRIKDKDGNVKHVSWEEAFNYTASKLKEIKDKYGPQAIAGISTGQLETEGMAIFGHVVRNFLGGNLDGNTRLCMATSVVAHKQSFGFDAPPYTLNDFELSDTIFLIGANPIVAHPIIWDRIKLNKLPNKKVIVIDPRKSETAKESDYWYGLKSKTDIYLFYTLANVLIEKGWINEEYINNYTENFEAYKEHVKNFPLSKAQENTGLSEEQVMQIATMIHEGKIIMHEDTDVLLSDYALLKLDEDQFEKLDQQYILRFKKESYGYSALTNQKQFYIENYPSIVIEKSTIDEIITMMVRGKEK